MSFIEEIKDKITLDAVTGYRVLCARIKAYASRGTEAFTRFPTKQSESG